MSDETRENFTHKLRYTPMRDLLRGRVSGRLNLNERLAAANLPESIQSLIHRIVRKTKLWPLEKMDVADELIAHFADGLESGATTEQLIESFGDERTAAKLIRRAKRRNRPIVWHIFQAIFRSIEALIAVYLLITLYFYTGRPSPRIDYIEMLNQPIEKIPLDQRAWPLYRQAVLAIGFPNEHKNDWWELMSATPGSDQWPNLVVWLNAHQSTIKLIREGADKPTLGFLLGPRGSVEDAQVAASEKEHTFWNDSLISVVLPHLGDARLLSGVLGADAELAMQVGDSQRFVVDVTAIIHIADQLQETNFLVADLVAISLRESAVTRIDAALVHLPSLLTDAQLQELAHRLAKPDNDSGLLSYEGERLIFLDVLQRMYTDNGYGDGRFTPEGIEIFKSLAPMNSQLQSPAAIFAISAAPLMMLSASRQDLLQADNELINLVESNLQHPLRDAHWAEYQQRVEQFGSSTMKSIRYGLLLALAPSLEHSQWTAERYLGHRDGVLVGIVLEVFHRQHGAYPKSLDELTPLLLPAVPLDRITGEKVKYRIIDGHPIVYSVGADRKDDGGRQPLSKFHDPNEAAKWNLPNNAPVPDGDWILYPQNTAENASDN